METPATPNRFEINNAGLCLLFIYTRQLFSRLNYLKDYQFISEESQIRAIFLLQYLAYGKEQKYTDNELLLNKLIVGWPSDRPVPQASPLTKEEIDMTEELMNALRQNWSKMKNTSPEAIRMAFIQRKGYLEFDDPNRQWTLTVEEKPYDMLLQTLPWSYTPSRFPWAKYTIITKWRN